MKNNPKKAVEPEKPAIAERDIQKDRLERLEKRVDTLPTAQLDGHLKIITIVVSCVAGLIALSAIIVTLLSVLSKSEAKEATREMKDELRHAAQASEQRFATAMSELEKRFAALAGNSLKRPRLLISTTKGPLMGQEFEIPPGSSLPIYPLFLENAGDRKTDPLSIRLHCTAPIGVDNGTRWLFTANSDKDYPAAYFLRGDSMGVGRPVGIEVSAKETWTVDREFTENAYPHGTNRVLCKLLIYYGADEPAEARFTIKFK